MVGLKGPSHEALGPLSEQQQELSLTLYPSAYEPEPGQKLLQEARALTAFWWA